MLPGSPVQPSTNHFTSLCLSVLSWKLRQLWHSPECLELCLAPGKGSVSARLASVRPARLRSCLPLPRSAFLEACEAENTFSRGRLALSPGAEVESLTQLGRVFPPVTYTDEVGERLRPVSQIRPCPEPCDYVIDPARELLLVRLKRGS